MPGLTMRPEDVPDELVAVVADRLDVAGLAGMHVRVLARDLLAHSLAALTPVHAATVLGPEWTVAPRTSWDALNNAYTAREQDIERRVRLQVAAEIENSLLACDLGLPCRDNAARIARGER